MGHTRVSESRTDSRSTSVEVAANVQATVGASRTGTGAAMPDWPEPTLWCHGHVKASEWETFKSAVDAAFAAYKEEFPR